MSPRSENLTAALHLFALSGFAVAQPLFDLLGQSPALLHVHHAEPRDIVLLVLAACLALPAVLLVLELVAALLGRRVRALVHLAFVAALAALIVLPVVGRQMPAAPGILPLACAALLGVGATVLYHRSSTVRGLVSALAAAVPVFAVLFLLWSPVSALVVPPDLELGSGAGNASAPVIMVVFDEFSLTSLLDPHGRIDKKRFPNFAKLAGTSSWFPNATAVATMTEMAVGAIVSGRYPPPGSVDWAALRSRNLFTLLAPSHRLAATEPYVWYCPRALCPADDDAVSGSVRLAGVLSDAAISFLHLATPATLRDSLPPLSEPMLLLGATEDHQVGGDGHGGMALDMIAKRLEVNQVSLSERADAFDAFLSSIEPSTGPVLHYLHSLLPHDPSVFLPSGAVCATASFRDPYSYGDPLRAAQAYQRHLQQVGFVDLLIGRLIARLEEVGLWDRSLLVIVADHGTSYLARDHRRGLTAKNECDILPVPLFIKAPGQREGRIVARNVEVIDVLPTVAQVLGIEVPFPVDGQSAIDETLPERPRKIVAGPYWPPEKTIFGDRSRLERPARLPSRCMGLAAKRQMFVDVEDGEPLLRVGRYGAVVGKAVSTFGAIEEAGFAATIVAAGQYLDVEPARGFMPCTIAGRLEGAPAAAAGKDIAVAVNGTIVGLAKIEPSRDGALRFDLPVPETVFRQGRNAIEVFQLSGMPFAPRLARIPITSQAYVLQDGGQSIETPDHRVLPVRPDAVAAVLDRVELGNTTLDIRGRATILDGAPAPLLVIFLDDTFHHAGALPTPVAGELEAKFALSVPIPPNARADGAKVRVFALSEAGASELPSVAPAPAATVRQTQG